MRTTARSWAAVAVAVAVLVVSGCGAGPGSASPPSNSTSTTSGSTTTSTSTSTVVEARHLDHAALAAALVAATEITWLPAGVTVRDDSDLTSALTLRDCAGVTHTTPLDEAASTNRRYVDGIDDRLGVTLYDVATVEDATAYLDALAELVRCITPPESGMSFETLTFADGDCDQTFAVLTHQPVSETIDVFCRVGNLVAAIRLYASATIEQAQQALTVTGQHLRAAFAGG
jgi:hypothetical protein